MIEAARAEDAPWIADIWNQIIRETTATFTTVEKTPADIEALIRTQPVFLVDRPNGFATCGAFRSGPGYADALEHTIYLARTARGRGHGARLLAALEQACLARGARTMVAGISGSNTGAIRFHTAAGYSEVAQMPGIGQKWGQRLDLVLMQKNLQE